MINFGMFSIFPCRLAQSSDQEVRDHGLILSFCKRLSALVNRMVRFRNILSTEKYLRKIVIEKEISQEYTNEMYSELCK